MPRRRQDQQAPVAAPGQAYGENQDQIQAQNVIPLPQRDAVAAAAATPAQAPLGPPPGAPVSGGNPIEALLAAAQGTPPPAGGGLAAPSARPGEPVTAGLPVGPGPGPEALGPSRARASTVRDSFEMLAELTGDPRYKRLAALAVQQGV